MNVNTLHSLLGRLDDEALVAEVERLYEEGMQGDYRDALSEIRKLTPVQTDLCCVLDQDPDGGVGVFGKYLGDEQRWALTCTSWLEWLSMPVLMSPEVGKLTDLETAAHILYEMTWSGWSEEDATAHREMISSRMDDVLEAIESGDTSGFHKIELPKPN